MSCDHLRERVCRNPNAELFNIGVVPMVCARCPSYEGPSRGLGDIVHAVTTVTGIAAGARALERITGTPCGCAARRAALNAALPCASTVDKSQI